LKKFGTENELYGSRIEFRDRVDEACLEIEKAAEISEKRMIHLSPYPPASWFIGEAIICFLAAIGGVLVFKGLVMEGPPKGEGDKAIQRWKLLRLGILVEIIVATAFAGKDGWHAWQINNEITKNNPLNQPISEVSAVFRILVSATNFTPNKFTSLDDTTFNCGPFYMRPKNAAWFTHVDNYATGHASYYGIAITFDQEILPTSEWNDINNTNGDPFVVTDITVSNALSSATNVFAYIGFIPTNAVVVRASARVLFNGFQKDFQITNNCVYRQFAEWNPEKHGIFITISNAVQK